MRRPTPGRRAWALLLLALGLPCARPRTGCSMQPINVKLCRQLWSAIAYSPGCKAAPPEPNCCVKARAVVLRQCSCWKSPPPHLYEKVRAAQKKCGVGDEIQPDAVKEAITGAGQGKELALGSLAGVLSADSASTAAKDFAEEVVVCDRGGAQDPRCEEGRGTAQGSAAAVDAGDAGAGALSRPQAQPIRLFVGVLSAAKNSEARAAVRETWGSSPALHRLVFVAAKPRDEELFDALRREASEHGDIVVLPQVWEGYENIGHQSLEVLRSGALDRDATHVLKADDDSYVRVEALLALLAASPRTRLFLGRVEHGTGPIRDPGSKWHVSEEEWRGSRYPPWAHGAGYVLSQDLVRPIAFGGAMKALNHTVFKLEDVAVGSWVAWVAAEQGWEVRYRDAPFDFWGCGAPDILSHYQTPAQLRCMWAAGGRCCPSGADRSRLDAASLARD